MDKLGYTLLAIFAISLVVLFPKPAGLHGEVSLEEEQSCQCIGYEKTNKISGAFVYNTYCFGIPHSCSNVLDCKEGQPCWHEEQACKCPNQDAWAPTDYPCKDADSCVCTHNECSTGLIGG